MPDQHVHPSERPARREQFVLVLESLPGQSTPASVRLRLALKVLLRRHGLRAVEVRPDPAPVYGTPADGAAARDSVCVDTPRPADARAEGGPC